MLSQGLEASMSERPNSRRASLLWFIFLGLLAVASTVSAQPTPRDQPKMPRTGTGTIRGSPNVTLRSGHHVSQDAAVLGAVKTRATLCLLRLHLRKSRNSRGAIIIISLYPSALA